MCFFFFAFGSQGHPGLVQGYFPRVLVYFSLDRVLGLVVFFVIPGVLLLDTVEASSFRGLRLHRSESGSVQVLAPGWFSGPAEDGSLSFHSFLRLLRETVILSADLLLFLLFWYMVYWVLITASGWMYLVAGLLLEFPLCPRGEFGSCLDSCVV